MKKIIFTLLFIILGIGIVRADGFNSEFNWKKDDLSIKSIETFAKVNDGYLAGGYVNNTNSYIIKTDETGQELAHAYLDGERIIDVYEYGTYYFAIEEDHWQIVLYKLRKSDLNIEGKTITPAERNGQYYIIEHKDSKIYLTTYGNELSGVYSTTDYSTELLAIFDLNNGQTSFVDYKDTGAANYVEFQEYFSKEHYLYFKDSASNKYPLNVVSDGTHNIVVGLKEENYEQHGYVAIYDKDNNFVKEYNSNSMYSYSSVIIKNGYIVAASQSSNRIDIISMDGKYIKSIDMKKEYNEDIITKNSKLINTDSGFAVAYGVCPANAIRGNDCPQSIRHYEMLYNISVKTDGNGEVLAEKTTEFGNEEVKFTVKPKEGYVLKEVRVTDAEGNVIIFKDYTFTMPYSDVTIEAVFVLGETMEQKNPETISGAIIFGALIVVFLSLSVGIYSFRKAKGLM